MDVARVVCALSGKESSASASRLAPKRHAGVERIGKGATHEKGVGDMDLGKRVAVIAGADASPVIRGREVWGSSTIE